MYLTIHGIKHEFARLIWVLDIANALAELHECELNQALILARGLGIEGALLTTCELARLSFCSRLPNSIVEAIACRPAISIRAAAIWNGVLLGGPPNRKITPQGAELFLAPRTRCQISLGAADALFSTFTTGSTLGPQHHRIPLHGMLFVRPLRLLAKHGLRPVWHALFPLLR